MNNPSNLYFRDIKPDVMARANAIAEALSREFQAKPLPVQTPVFDEPLIEKPARGGTRNPDIDEATLDRLTAAEERRLQSERIRLDGRKGAAAIAEKWAPWEGTPETNERIAQIPVRRRQWPLDRMHQLGKISADELAAANEIVIVHEGVIRSGLARCASLEARVDNSGSASAVLAESLAGVRLQVTYHSWRRALPTPKALVIDMVTTSQPYVALARRFKVDYRKARSMLIRALRSWMDIREDVRKSISAEDVLEVYARLGEGVLLPPRPKMHGPVVQMENANG